MNPAIPGGGGFVGESKGRHPPCRTRRPGGPLDPGQATPEDRLAHLRRFLVDQSLSYPVVLKPDVGERGGGVRIVPGQAERCCISSGPGNRFWRRNSLAESRSSVFYYRLPGEERGKIFAITDKHFPTVVGDGRSALEHLILADERAVCMAPTFLARFAARLDEVPAAGQKVPLIELGTHSLGAEFGTASLASPALEAAIDALSRGYEGFWFGRYDVKRPPAKSSAPGETSRSSNSAGPPLRRPASTIRRTGSSPRTGFCAANGRCCSRSPGGT
ncbi:MAG: hypothetical protein R2882_11580 [Gemmatimonadales bacterium]